MPSQIYSKETMNFIQMIEFTPETRWLELDFKSLAQTGGRQNITLQFKLGDEEQIAKILVYYEMLRCINRELKSPKRIRDGHRKIERICRKLQDTIDLLGELPTIRFIFTDTRPAKDIKILDDIRNRYSDLRRRRELRDPDIAGLLFGLEKVFLNAGGQSSGYSKGDGSIKSRFINFCIKSVSYLPTKYRPSNNLITDMWVELFRARKKNELTDQGGSVEGHDWSSVPFSQLPTFSSWLISHGVVPAGSD
jgi:hypothetical protein